MIFGFTILATALLLSVVAAYYSIMGLTAIFSAAPIPVIIMGASLELAKIVTTVWLHNNWHRISWLFKTYLVPAVFFLMMLTSMGIFGLLSKAHSDQSLVSGDVVAKIAIYDEKIQIERENIDADRKQLKQMDEAVDQVMARSTSEEGASRSSAIRKSQQKERVRLLEDITTSQQRITTLNEQRAPIAAEVRKVEAEVGPIKYIAALLYGDNPDANVLERAVRFVIIMIVLVFDPLALCLILSANKQFEWAKNKRETETVEPVEPCPHVTDEPPIMDQELQQFLDSARETAQSIDNGTFVAPAAFNPGPFISETIGSAHYEPDDDLLTDQPIEQIRDTETLPLPMPVMGQVALAGGEYIEVNGKRMHHRAFDSHSKDAVHAVERHKMAQLQADDNLAPVVPVSGFGTAFPNLANRGDTYLRVDRLPTVLYKFNGRDWIEVDKEISNSYVYEDSYIDHLIGRIGSGEYDPDLLSDTEREAIVQRLSSSNPPAV